VGGSANDEENENVPMETALKRLKTLLDMSYDKFFIAICCNRHTPFSKLYSHYLWFI
jgi:hypothetical protein